MILRVALVDHSRIVGGMLDMNAIEQEAWFEYELVQGVLDAEQEEQEMLAYAESRLGGWDDSCDGSQACYNALTNDPTSWK